MCEGRDARWLHSPGPMGASQRHGAEGSGVGRVASAGRSSQDIFRRSRRRRDRRPWLGGVGWMLLVLLISWIPSTSAVLLDFDNCLSAAVVASNPRQLQFVPLDVSVIFNMQNSLYPLNITVYGNVSGTANGETAPAPNDPSWSNPNDTVGKIVDLDVSNDKWATLLSYVNVLSFLPYHDASRFCDSVTQGSCPLGPVFYANSSNLSSLRAFSIEHDMLSSYHFSTLSSTLVIKSGDVAVTELGCISVNITPDLGSSLRNTLAFLPLIVLFLVGVATVTAAIYSPWGTTDPFHWTSNYGRDEDVLRLVTPGFGDCLQYIQFAVLTGALSLNYPGYYQPVVSQFAWSVLMFNQSFINPGHEQNPVKDGVYAVNATYGLDKLDQYVGMPSARDIWPGMMVWLLAIVAAVTLIIQIGFGLRYLHRKIANNPEEDLRAKNMPFTVGNIIRIVFNYLLLPLISISFFQLVIAGESPAYSVALAVVVIVILVCFSLWTVRLIANARPKSYLFDDLSTVLLYGPLYNTFCDDAAAFALVPIFLTFVRGIAIGALQPSGIAQIVLLAICEVVSVLTLVAFKPFASPTSMNLYHTCFSIVRFLTILLSVVFVPSLGISQAARGWIGYIILFLHALVMVFGFFLNALQTLIEVIARLAGAGGNAGGVTRGGLVKVFGMRQLSRRVPRQSVGTRQSMGSEAAMLGHTDERLSSQFDGSRPRSLSGSSAMLLNRAGASEGRGSAFFDTGSAHGGSHSRANSSGFFTPSTPGGFTAAGYQTPGSNSPKSGPVFAMHPHDPYYRPPRPRKKGAEIGASGEKGRGASRHTQRAPSYGDGDDDIIEGPSISGRGTPIPAYIPAPKDDLDLDDPRQSRKDYAVREVDFYYRVRGPPLSQSGTRKLKTGPADPTGPVSSATGFFRNLFRGKTKENGKGFEVVRSARAPPPGLFPEAEEFHDQQEPYRDEPDEQGAATHSREPSETDVQYRDSDGESRGRTAATHTSLPKLQTGGDIELPSRVGSQHSSPSPCTAGPLGPLAPDEQDLGQKSIPTVTETVVGEPAEPEQREEPSVFSPGQLHPSGSVTSRLPFSAMSSPSRDRNFSIASTTASTTSSRRQRADGAARVERPSSMGYVAQYRTRDNIHEASPDEPTFAGSAAELVDDEVHHADGEH
ncbi:integral membrane protein [Aspergillus heteromorphus CBS 117.55]|uniref:Integral membrane protein n=1 Tax=Aspergillus heteromorphus CBS 117.55 TaxID=1448321 RepID=A0A317VUP6_9EURO|nr:uncharacterized protein BO70DRAFT_71691 [Aspergillus heteromorphus CBS 117.55]PWY77061.1 integral membrane protein [Aspergillus heteromorphus CBS 117.55]